MVSIKSTKEISLMNESGKINYECHEVLKSHIKVGVSTKELDKIAYDFITSHGATPSFLGLNDYPASICASINEEVVHGIPSDYKLQDGDIISIDIGTCYKGYHSDAANTYVVGTVSNEVQKLIEGTKKALEKGISIIKEGIDLELVSKTIESVAKEYNLGIVKELVGHGIGKKLHEAPDVPNYSGFNSKIILKSGMTLAIEPMLTLGNEKVAMLDDGWTIVTQDNLPAAHFEHTILVTKSGFKILKGD